MKRTGNERWTGYPPLHNKPWFVTEEKPSPISRPYGGNRLTYHEEPNYVVDGMDLLAEIMLPDDTEDDKKEADKIRKEAKKKCDEEQQAKEQERRRWATVVYRGKVYKRGDSGGPANPDHVGVPQPVWPECKEDGSCCWWLWYDFHASRQRPTLPPLKRGQRPTKKEVLDAIAKNGMVEYLEE
ncbi:hypothetical protein AAVH_39671 [Aphelenchoides avenae]|nr:hypothetical protein AAVH_39671 [Aphelenchus avenae]